jgi:hypothetical protein
VSTSSKRHPKRHSNSLIATEHGPQARHKLTRLYKRRAESKAAGQSVLKAEAEGWSVLTSRPAKPGGVL